MSKELERHTIDTQDKIINELRDEIERLRGLMKKSLIYSHSMPTTLVAAIEKEVSEHLVDRLLEVLDEMHDGEADWSEVWKARKALR